MKRFDKANLSPRALQQAKYNTARMNLLLVVIFTLINVLLVLRGSADYFLFSAFFPYFFVTYGMYVCGKMPAEWYGGDKSDYEFFNSSFFTTMLSTALIIIALYFVFWLFSKSRKSGWLAAAFVLFAIDSIGLVYMGGFSFDSILNIIFHAWVLYYLIVGVIAAKKLKDLPPEENEMDSDQEGVDYFPDTVYLKNDKEIENVAANYFRGREGVGGKLYFYKDRIIFKSHAFNIQTGNTAIRYADMKATKATKNLWLHNGLLIYTSDGKEHRFVIKHRDDIMEYVNRKISLSRAEF